MMMHITQLSRLWMLAMAAAVGLTGVVGCTVSTAGSAAPNQTAPATSAVPAQLTTAAAAPRYHNERDGYSLSPPPGWVSRPDVALSKMSALFVNPETDTSLGVPFKININVMVMASTDSLDQDIQAFLAGARTALKGYRRGTDQRVTLRDGHPAHLLGGTFRRQEHELRNVQLLVVDGGHLYAVTATAPSTSFAEHEQLLRSSLMSFALT